MDPQKKHVILIVENDPLLLDTYEKSFLAEGFEVMKSLDGEEGLKTALGRKPQILLLDVSISGMSAHDFLTELRRDPWGAHVPVLLLAHQFSAAEEDHFKAFSIKEYLIKAHITPIEVVDRVKALLR